MPPHLPPLWPCSTTIIFKLDVWKLGVSFSGAYTLRRITLTLFFASYFLIAPSQLHQHHHRCRTGTLTAAATPPHSPLLWPCQYHHHSHSCTCTLAAAVPPPLPLPCLHPRRCCQACPVTAAMLAPSLQQWQQNRYCPHRCGSSRAAPMAALPLPWQWQQHCCPPPPPRLWRHHCRPHGHGSIVTGPTSTTAVLLPPRCGSTPIVTMAVAPSLRPQWHWHCPHGHGSTVTMVHCKV